MGTFHKRHFHVWVIDRSYERGQWDVIEVFLPESLELDSNFMTSNFVNVTSPNKAVIDSDLILFVNDQILSMVAFQTAYNEADIHPL